MTAPLMVGSLGGWVRLWRRTLQSPVAQLPGDTFKVFIFALILANNQDREWAETGETIPRGSFATSQDHLATLTGLTRKKIRGSLSTLGRMEVIRANVRANRFTVITVVNFEIYQPTPDDEGQQKGQRQGQPRANRGPRREKYRSTEVTTPAAGAADNGACNGTARTPQAEIVAEHGRLFAELVGGGTPPVAGGAEHAMVADLLRDRERAHGGDKAAAIREVLAVLTVFFADAWVKEHGCTLNLLRSATVYNRLVPKVAVAAARQRSGSIYTEDA